MCYTTDNNIDNGNNGLYKRLFCALKFKHPLSMCLMNTRSIRNKTADFVDYVCENKFDLVAVTETWLKATSDSIRAQLCPTGYKFLDKPRKNCRGGGTTLLYRDSIKTSMTNSGQKESFEFSE